MNSNSEEALFQPAPSKPDAECEGDAMLAAHEQPETLPATPAEVSRPTIKLLERAGRCAFRDRAAGAGHDEFSEQHPGKISRAIQQFHHA